ncbi:hypothetical protein SISNIDRAFT_453882, partial [Sistotremastrum niveocremeum HHB9708]
IIQYAAKLLVPLLQLRARVQHRVGLSKAATSQAAVSWAKLGGIVSDARVLWRIWGLLPIFQWMISLEKTSPPTRRLLNIERIQGWSMLAYYPLEHLYYLGSHQIIPISSKKLEKLSLWSCRFWAVYVVLQFFHLSEDQRLLKLRERALRSVDAPEERKEIKRSKIAIANEFWTNVGYLPLTIHWSLEKGLFKNEAWVGIFGLGAAISSLRSGWQATAAPPSR